MCMGLTCQNLLQKTTWTYTQGNKFLPNCLIPIEKYIWKIGMFHLDFFIYVIYGLPFPLNNWNAQGSIQCSWRTVKCPLPLKYVLSLIFVHIWWWWGKLDCNCAGCEKYTAQFLLPIFLIFDTSKAHAVPFVLCVKTPARKEISRENAVWPKGVAASG